MFCLLRRTPRAEASIVRQALEYYVQINYISIICNYHDMNIVITNNNLKGKIPKFDCDGNHELLVSKKSSNQLYSIQDRLSISTHIYLRKFLEAKQFLVHSFIHDDQKYASRYKKVKRYIQYHSNCELVSEREFIEKRGVPIQKRERAIRANCLGILIYVYM